MKKDVLFKKDQTVETIRGLTIILVVAFHSAGDWNPSVGQGGDSYLFHHHFAFLVSDWIMPWFAAISGYVYALRPALETSGKAYIGNKLRRIMIPFFSAVTIMYLFRSLTPGINNPLPIQDIWRAYLFTFEHFWFLQSIFLVFIGVMLLERFDLISTYRKWQVSFVISIVSTLLIPGTDFFSIWGFLYLMPFFLLGCGIQRFHAHLFGSKLIILSGIIALACIALQQLVWFGIFDVNWPRTGIFGICSGLSTTVLIFRYRRSIPMFATIGYFSYIIYLYQGFGQAIGKRILGLFGFNSENALFLIMTLGGLCIPIVFEIVIRRFGVLRYILFGVPILARHPVDKSEKK